MPHSKAAYRDSVSDHHAGARAQLSVERGKAEGMIDTGEARIRELGYKQELQRNFGLISNASIGFTAISILTGITASFSIGFLNGGPVAIVYGWLLCSAFSLCVAAAMAEITSSFPISGGPYYWSVELTKGTPLPEAFVGWLTGWLNLLGQVALTASVDSCLSNHIAAMWVLYNGHVFQREELLLTYAVCLILHGVLNMMPARWIARLMALAGTYQLVAALTLILLIPCVAPTHQPASFVFTTFYGTDVASSGIPNDAYLFILGMLMSQYTITGYDACGHLSEETRNADRTAPWGIMIAVGLSVVLGFGYILALLFSIQDPRTLLTGAANGYAAGQIYYDASVARYNNASYAVGFMSIPLVAIFFCGASCVTQNSRMLWSFSRDGGIPLHRLWSLINTTTHTPLLAVWGMVLLAFLLGLPMLHSITAFQAVTSISTIGLYISYGIPIFMRLLKGRRFQPGPFSLGRASPYVGTAAVLWVGFITVAFVLPTFYPVTRVTLNYAGVAVATVVLGAVLVWFLPRIGARHWYRGELPTYDPKADPDVPVMPLAKNSELAGMDDSAAPDAEVAKVAACEEGPMGGHGSRSGGGSKRQLFVNPMKLTLLDLIHQYRPPESSSSGGGGSGAAARPGSWRAGAEMPSGSSVHNAGL